MNGPSSVGVDSVMDGPGAVGSDFAYPWTPDQGDGTYRNPIIYADYSDPDVIRVEDDFYLTASSFNCTPGLPILHSKDLVNWTIINHALKNLPHSRYAEVQPGCGVWAPAIRFHDGKYWIFFPMPDEGVYVTTADHPAHEWGEPWLLQEGKGLIDPCPLWDDDGKAYLVHAYAGSRAGIKHRLRVCPMAPDATRLLGEGQIVFHDPERHPTLEGPKFLKRNDWYYISAPAGGVEHGWQVILRSRNVYGPYEDKIVLQQGSTSINGPHQGALVDTPEGDWWFVHFQDAGLYGRITHLQPVQWQDDWPMMGNCHDGACEPVLKHTKPRASVNGAPIVPQTSDEFDSPELGPQWQWQANHEDGWCELDRKNNRLQLYPQLWVHKNLIQMPGLLLQKFPARSFTVETCLEFEPEQIGEEAGLIVVGEAFASLGIRKSETANQIVMRINDKQELLPHDAQCAVRLRVVVDGQGQCRFSFAGCDGWVMAPHIFEARKGVWMGAKVGLYSLKTNADAHAGHVAFDYFRFQP